MSWGASSLARTYAVVNLGCKVNRVESDAFEGQLARRGFVAARSGSADVVLINTCTVTSDAEKKTRKAVRRALRDHPDAQVIVTGCSVAIDAQAIASMDERILCASKQDIPRIIERMSAERSDDRTAARTGEAHAEQRVRRGVKIQDGCDNACTYCIVHVARGPSQSVPAESITQQCAHLLDAGVPEIMLTGINLGAYEHGGLDLAGLLAQLISELPLREDDGSLRARLRLSSIEPQNVSASLVRLIADAEGAICRHLHLPLQSGSSRVLREMDRSYGAERFMEVVDLLRSHIPSISITTDVIAGFPGETEGDLQETMDACRTARFSKLHVFPYSLREGTPAAERADQVPPQVKEARARMLRTLSVELRSADIAMRAGTRELAVVEREGVAMTESYHEVSVPASCSPGAIVSYAF